MAANPVSQIGIFFCLFVLNRNTCGIEFYYFGSGAFLGSGSGKVFSFYEPKQRKQKTQIETWACERQRRLGNAKKTGGTNDAE